MNKTLKNVIVGVLSLSVVALPLCACAKADDPNTLNIVCLDKGYGTEWIKTVCSKYEEISGKKVNLTASVDAGSTVSSHMASSKNKDDLYINVGSGWKTYAAGGKFTELDDIMDTAVTEPDGTNSGTVKERVLPDYAESLLFPARDGSLHTYRLPWTAGLGGIYYNAKMFNDNGWDIPTTTAELSDLCEQIVNDAVAVSGTTATVKPFVYTKQNEDYFDYLVYTWWGQLAGRDAIKEFCKFSSPDNFDASRNTTYGMLKTATNAWYSIFKNKAYSIDGTTNHDAQNAFALGKAAMMINGDWVYNEILNLKLNNADKFELGYMKTPVIDGAKECDVTYTIGEDQYIAIPNSSTKKDMAKDFIKLMISDWGCNVFADQAHGILAYSGSLSASTDDKFMKGALSQRAQYTTAFTDYPPVASIATPQKSTAMLNLNDKVNFWGTSAARPYLKLIIDDKTIEEVFNNVKSTVSQSWDSWKKDIGI